MEDLVLYAVGFALFACGWLFGLGIGVLGERNAWLLRGREEEMTAHYCNGQFYYVIPEKVFVRDYVRKEAWGTSDDETWRGED